MYTEERLAAKPQETRVKHLPTRREALQLFGRSALYAGLLSAGLASPEIIEAIPRGIQDVEGFICLWRITHMPSFYYDARKDRAVLSGNEGSYALHNLGNSFARGQVDFRKTDNAAALARAANIQSRANVFGDLKNPPGRLLVVRRNQATSEEPWGQWRQEDNAKNGGTLVDVHLQIQALRKSGQLQTPTPKILVIGAGDNDTFLTPDVQTHFASLQQNIYQEETLHIAKQLYNGIQATGDNFVNYLQWLDQTNRAEKWNVRDIFLLGTPYLTNAEGIVVKLGLNDYPVMPLAQNGLARQLLDNVSDTINTMKGEVIERYRAARPDSSYALHLLSARLPEEEADGTIVPIQLYQHYTFRGYNRLTARMAYMMEDAAGNNLGELYFADCPQEQNLART